MNGTVEAANKNIKRIFQKMVKMYKDLHEMLLFALYGYRTSVYTSTGATPYSLIYGMEVMFPIEIEIPSLRDIMEACLDEAEWVQSRYDQLNFIKKKCSTVVYHCQLYQRRLKRSFGKKVLPRVYQAGELMLKRYSHIHSYPQGKWTPNYEGPFIVKKAFS